MVLVSSISAIFLDSSSFWSCSTRILASADDSWSIRSRELLIALSAFVRVSACSSRSCRSSSFRLSSDSRRRFSSSTSRFSPASTCVSRSTQRFSAAATDLRNAAYAFPCSVPSSMSSRLCRSSACCTDMRSASASARACESLEASSRTASYMARHFSASALSTDVDALSRARVSLRDSICSANLAESRRCWARTRSHSSSRDSHRAVTRRRSSVSRRRSASNAPSSLADGAGTSRSTILSTYLTTSLTMTWGSTTCWVWYADAVGGTGIGDAATTAGSCGIFTGVATGASILGSTVATTCVLPALAADQRVRSVLSLSMPSLTAATMGSRSARRRWMAAPSARTDLVNCTEALESASDDCSSSCCFCWRTREARRSSSRASSMVLFARLF